MLRLLVAVVCCLFVFAAGEAAAKTILIAKVPTLFENVTVCDRVDDMVALVRSLRAGVQPVGITSCWSEKAFIATPVAAIRAEEVSFARLGQVRQTTVLMFWSAQQRRFLFIVRTRLLTEA